MFFNMALFKQTYSDNTSVELPGIFNCTLSKLIRLPTQSIFWVAHCSTVRRHINSSPNPLVRHTSSFSDILATNAILVWQSCFHECELFYNELHFPFLSCLNSVVKTLGVSSVINGCFLLLFFFCCCCFQLGGGVEICLRSQILRVNVPSKLFDNILLPLQIVVSYFSSYYLVLKKRFLPVCF